MQPVRQAKRDPYAPGKLHFIALELFEVAYGLSGRTRVDHKTMVKATTTALNCSERAVWALLYGNSYPKELEHARRQVPGYTPCKSLDGNFEQLAFYWFDGNVQSPASTVSNDT